MAKKFGKFLFFTAALGTAAATAYYFIQKKENEDLFNQDEDYDDFSDEQDDNADASRSYVSLNSGNAQSGEDTDDSTSEKEVQPDTPAEDSKPESAFTPLAEHAAAAVEKAEETVEEFFDEDDPTEEGSLIKNEDN